MWCCLCMPTAWLLPRHVSVCKCQILPAFLPILLSCQLFSFLPNLSLYPLFHGDFYQYISRMKNNLLPSEAFSSKITFLCQTYQKYLTQKSKHRILYIFIRNTISMKKKDENLCLLSWTLSKQAIALCVKYVHLYTPKTVHCTGITSIFPTEMWSNV
jgi:hypothetical protein